MLWQYQLLKTTNVVYTGNLEPYQGVDLLLDAWRIVSGENKTQAGDRTEYSLLMIGGTPEQIERYRAVAREMGLQGSVHWIGRRPLGEMPAWMAMARVLVSPRSEGTNTPLKIYTYMGSGRPIVATRRETHTQVLDDTTAFLAEPEPAAFAGALVEALGNRPEGRKRAEAAMDRVNSRYSFASFSERLLGSYADAYRRKHRFSSELSAGN